MRVRAVAPARVGEYEWILKLAGALSFATALAFSAQLRVPLAFTPVPITMQTLVVMFAGAALGVRWGVAAVLGYLAAGLAGAPFFAGGAFGWAVIAGPTGGYLVGFVAGAAVAGLAHGRRWPARAVFLVLALVAIYACGLFQLAVIWGAGWRRAVALGFAPFIVGDVLKCALALASFGPLAAAARRLCNVRGSI